MKQVLSLILLVATLLVAMPAEADYKKDYLNAVKALNKGDVKEAISDLQAAIAENPDADPAVRFYGMRREPYIPHFYLGNALFRDGDCAGAMAAWQVAQQQGVASQVSEGASLEQNMTQCAVEADVDLSEFVASANQALQGLDSAIDRFGELSGESLLATDWASRWRPEQETASSLAQRLRSDLSTADAADDQAGIEAVTAQARTEASRISGLRDLALAAVEDRRSDQAAQLAQARESAGRELRQAVASAGTLQLPDGANDTMRSLISDLGNQVSRANGISESASALNLRELAQGINNTVRRYQQAEQTWRAEMQSIADRTPPPELKLIAEAYFSGDYQAVSRTADPNQFAEDRPKVQSLLFRAAASYTLYVLSGESDSGLLQQAESDIRAIKAINADFSPYIAAFSPSFLELFRRTG